MNITDFRKQYPQYDHVDDSALLSTLHEKYYSHVGFDEFSAKFNPAAKTTLRESISEGIDNAQKRGFEIAGNTQKFAGTLIDTFVDKPAEALANITGFNPGVWYDEQNGLQASWNMPTDKQTKIGEGLQKLSDQAIETDTGYKQLNTLDDFEADPGVGTFFNMMAENGIPVAMDAVASLFGMPMYAASEIQRLGDERAKNKGKDKADWQDIYEASPAAIINVTGDRLLANTILGRVGGAIKNTKGDSIADKAIKVAKAVGTAGAIGAGTEGVQEGIEYSETHRNTQAGFNDKDFWKNVRAGAYIGGGVGAGGRAITAPIEASRQQTEIEQLDSDYSEALQKELDSIKAEMNAKSQDLNESKQRAEQGDELDKAEYESKKTRFEDDLKAANQTLNARVHEILNQNTKAGGNLLDGINKITGIDRQDKAQAERMRFNALDERINAKREADSQELADAEREVFADKFGLPMRKTETGAFTVDSKGTVSPTTDTLDILTSKDATKQYRNQIKVPGNDFRQDQKTFIDTSIKQGTPITANTELAEPMFGIEGGKGRIYSEKAGELDFNYRIVEAKDVNPQIETSDNQARDRKRIDSQAQIMQMADNLNPALLLDAPTMRDGAPVVTSDGKIIAGNGRAAAINQAYQLNKADGYKQQVRQEAQRLGFSQEQIDAVKNPVIIRQLDRNDETGELAILSNEEGAASMSAMEQAAVDAKRIGDISGISITETGDLTNDSLIWAARKIVNETGIAKRGEMMSANGTISENGKARIRNAIIYKAYGDSPVLSNLLESRDDGFNNITKALSATASKVASIKDGIDAGDYYDAGIDKPLVDALGAFSSIKASGLSAEEALAQNDMFSEDPPETKAIVKVLFDNIRSANKIREFIDSYNDVLASKGSPNQFDLLGGEDVTIMEIIDYVTKTRQNAVSRAEPKTTATQRGIGVDTEAGGQDQQNERQGKETGPGSNTQDEQSRVEPGLLTGYTQADLDARDQQIADAEKAEQEAVERDAINAKADQFTLTGSDTYLDQAAVNGQEDMLGELDDATKELPTQKTNQTAQEAAQPVKKIKLAKSGKPFKTAKSAKISATFKETPNAEIVQVEGGFGVRSAENIDDKTTSQSKTDGSEQQKKPIKNRFASIADFVRDAQAHSNEYIYTIGLPPEELIKHGVPKLPMRITSKTVRKGITEKHNLSESEMIKVLSSLDDHLAVFKTESKTSKAAQGAITILTPSKDTDKDPVTVSIHLDRKHGEIKVNLVRSIHGKSNAESQLNKWIREGRGLFVDQNRIEAIHGITLIQFQGNANASKYDNTKTNQQNQDAEQVNIDDFGEKLGGARKDLSMSERVKANTSDEQFIISNPLSKIWPKVEIDKTKETDKGIALFSKEKYSGSGKIKPADLQAEVNAFIESLPGIKQYGLSIEILESPEQAFGEEAVAVSSAERASGAYLAESKKMYLFNANISNKTQARRTLRHEILAHHGLNLFSVADKKAIFQAVTATRKSPAFKKDWEQVDSLYTELNDEQKAEEIIASIAEEQPGLAKRFLDSVVNKIIEILKKIGFIKKGEIIARSQLRGLVAAMADGISRGVPQQTFPKSGEQYSKNKKRFNDTTEDQERFLGKIGRNDVDQTVKERVAGFIDRMGIRIKQGLTDRYASLLELDKAVGGDNVVKESTQMSSWVLARMSEAGGGALTAMLKGGRIKYNADQKIIDVDENSQGMLDMLAESLGSSKEIDRFMGWIAAKQG